MRLRSGYLVLSDWALRRLPGLVRRLGQDPLVIPQPGQVVGGRGQSHFDGHAGKAPTAEAAQAALFFQHSEDRLDDRLAQQRGDAAIPAQVMVP